MRVVMSLLAFFFLVAGVVGAAAVWSIHRFEAPSPTTETTVLLIERGSGLQRITTQLQEAGFLPRPGDEYIFPLMVKGRDAATALRAGEYEIPAGASMAAIMHQLVTGTGVVRHVLTVPEGLVTADILDLVRRMEVLTGDITLEPGEGRLLPETYQVQRGDSRDSLVQRMMTAMDAALTELWETRQDGLPLATPEEALILASIIEKETGVPEERRHVASVFINRLKINMRLQTDPTVIYGMAPGVGRLDRPLRRADLQVPTPWNTYTIDGLPPTPIANPGRASLAAALDPLETRDLYFVADGSGGHAFARTLEEHNRNVARWRQIQRGQ